MPRKKARTPCCSPWPALPPDIAGKVLLRLPSYTDRICFGAVCRSWRASAAQHHRPPRLPCVVFPDGSFAALPAGDRRFRLPRAAGYDACSGGWLVFKIDGDGGGYSFANPFSKGAAMAPLPSLSSAREHNEPAGAARERVLDEYDVAGMVLRPLDGGRCAGWWCARPASSPRSSAKGGSASSRCAGRGRRRGRWRRLKDIAVHRGDHYAVDHNEDLLAVAVGEDGGAPAVSWIRRAVEGDPPILDMRRRYTLHYLVDAGDELLMVRREVCRQFRPDRCGGVEERLTVFKADFASTRWAEVRTLGDGMALCVGQWGSRAVRAPDELRMEWTDQIFVLDDVAADQPVWRPQYSLSAYEMGCPGTFSILHVTSRDGNPLSPATWLFPQEGTRVATQ